MRFLSLQTIITIINLETQKFKLLLGLLSSKALLLVLPNQLSL